MITETTRLIDITVGELISIITNAQKIAEHPVIKTEYSEMDYIHGYKGLADILGCSTTTIYHNMDKYRPAIVKNVGRKILFKRSEIKRILECKN